MAAAQVSPLPANNVDQREQRRAIIESAWGTTLAEGVSPGPEVWALSQRYIEGELTMEEVGAAIRAMSGI